MANRTFRAPLGHLEVDVVELFAELTIGAAGAVTLTRGLGITSATKEASAGQYTLLLADSYNEFLGGSITILDDTDSAQTVGILTRFQSEAVDNATPTVVIQCAAPADGADANPADGAKLYVSIKLRNSSVT